MVRHSSLQTVAAAGRSFRRGSILSVAGLALAALSAHPASAETRSYVVEWMTGASYNQDGDCTGGVNLDIDLQYKQDLMLVGMSQAEVDKLFDATEEGGGAIYQRDPLAGLITNRGRVDGKPVNAFNNPAAVPDPHLHYVTGKYGYGFNLDGRGEASPNGFEDPETHEKGVNNQMFRALGCFQTFRGTDKARPVQWAYVWDGLRPGMPAWLITISGNDLSKDGDATITFDRARDHVTRDANGDVERDMTYRIDPDPRSHSVFKATVKNQVLTITDHGDFRQVMGELFFGPELYLKKTHLRMKLKDDGGLDGIIGGYQPWTNFYTMSASGAQGFESSLGVDAPGLWHLLVRLADADPDPKTGQNMSMSAAYRIEAVPAFLVAAPGSTKTSQAGK